MVVPPKSEGEPGRSNELRARAPCDQSEDKYYSDEYEAGGDNANHVCITAVASFVGNKKS